MPQYTHPGFAVDVGLLLEEKLHELDVTIVTAYVEGSVAHLQGGGI